MHPGAPDGGNRIAGELEQGSPVCIIGKMRDPLCSIHSSQRLLTLPDFLPASPPTLLSLEDEHFTVDAANHSDSGIRFRFRHCREEKATFDFVIRKVEDDPQRRDRLLRCGSAAVVQRNRETSAIRVTAFTCSSRHCPVCRIHYAIERAEKLTKMMTDSEAFKWKFITLTLRSVDEPLADQLDHLRNSFRRLRQQTTWKRNVVGGRAVIELSYNVRRRQWHPHLHILAESKYIDQASLSKAWFEASDGSSIVDIRAVRSATDAAAYLAKYLSKGIEIPDPHERTRLLEELYLATRGKKLLITFGEVDDTDDMFDEEPATSSDADWEVVGTLASIVRSAALGDAQSRSLLASIGFSP